MKISEQTMEQVYLEIEKSKKKIQDTILELTIFYAISEAQKGSREDFASLKVANFLVAGAMSVLHNVVGQRGAHELVSAIVDNMVTDPEIKKSIDEAERKLNDRFE